MTVRIGNQVVVEGFYGRFTVLAFKEDNMMLSGITGVIPVSKIIKIY